MLRVASLVLLAAVMAGCSTQGATCSGFTRAPAANDPAKLVVEERRLSEWIVAHNEYGATVGCW